MLLRIAKKDRGKSSVILSRKWRNINGFKVYIYGAKLIQQNLHIKR